MADETDTTDKYMVVTIGNGSGDYSDHWYIAGPYWKADGIEGAADAPSFIVEGQKEAMAYATGIVAMTAGCKLEVYPSDPQDTDNATDA